MHNILLPILVIFLTTYSQLILRVRLHNRLTGSSVQNLGLGYFVNVFTDFWVCSSIAAFLLSFVCWSVALSNNVNATKAYPIVSALTIFFVSLANFIIFQDKLNISNILGGVFIVFGIFLLLR